MRDPARFASWGWQARKGRPTGLVLPSGHGLGDHLAQWDDSLCPDYWTTDKLGRRRYLQPGRRARQVETFPGGFAVSERTELHLAAPRRGDDPPPAVLDHRAMVALPDGRTVVFAAAGRTVMAVRRLATMDINWRFVRSTFCGMKRTILHEGGHTECRHVKGLTTPWLNVDDILAIVPIGGPARVSCEPFGKVDSHGVPIAPADPFGTHAGHTVRLGVCSLAPRDYEPGQEIFAACVAFTTNVDAAGTKRVAETCREDKIAATTRVYRIRGCDRKHYAVVVNGTDSEARVAVTHAAARRLLTPNAARIATKPSDHIHLSLIARGCALLAQ